MSKNIENIFEKRIITTLDSELNSRYLHFNKELK